MVVVPVRSNDKFNGAVGVYAELTQIAVIDAGRFVLLSRQESTTGEIQGKSF
jgi:hypothetical protein